MYDFDPGWFRLMAVTALVIGVAALLAWLQKKTRFGSLKRCWEQLIIGVVFGCLAVFATETGVPLDGASINVRDAEPLVAGMLFGGPAGIIAGVIGGAERWLAADWGAGQYTRLASSLITVLAGCFGAVLRYWFFRRQRPPWWYALSVALCIESLHMLLILVTNIQELEAAFRFVEGCTFPMTAANCLAVVGSAVVVRRMDGPTDPTQHERLEYILQRALFFSVLVAMVVSGLFIWVLHSTLIIEKVRSQLEVKLLDSPQGVRSAMNAALVGYADWLAASVPEDEAAYLAGLPAAFHDAVREAYIIDPETGQILASADGELTGTSVPAEWERAFTPAAGTAGYAAPGSQSFLDGENIKYVMTGLDDGRMLAIGFDLGFVQTELDRSLELETENRHVGQTGYLMMLDENGNMYSSNGEIRGSLESLGFDLSRPDEILLNSGLSQPVYYMSGQATRLAGIMYTFIAAQTVEEATFVSNLAMYVTILIEIIVFAVLFMKVSSLIRGEMVRQLDAVNASLAVLTDGNLDELVDVRSAEEFSALSDGINAMVASLKSYSTEMQQRLDRELEFARVVQQAALPSVFPPFPARKDFEIYASMDAARVVGGDFYDFYLLNDHQLAFLIADVSGKGVPAAMFMMRTKTQIKDLIESGLDVAEVFSRTNDALCENNAANMFVTAWMGVLDLSTGLLRYANAGHTPPLVERFGGTFRYAATDADFVLGGLSGMQYRAGEVRMQPGDTVFIYTDGITEAENAEGQQFGEERLLRSLQGSSDEPLDVLCGRVLADVELFAGNAEQSDDITMLAVRLNGLMSRWSVQLRPDPASTEAAMHFARQRLGELQISHRRTEGIMAEIQKVWQQILGRPGSEVILTLRREDDALVVRFYDDGPQAPPPDAGPDVQVECSREGSHNSLELRWRISTDDQDAG